MFEAPNRSVPESHLVRHLKRNEIGEMEEVEKFAEFVRSLAIRMGLAIGHAVEDDQVISNIAPRTEANNAKHRIREEAFIQHEVDDFKLLMGVREERDGVSVLIVR